MDTLGQVVVFIIEVVLFSEVNMYREGTSKYVLYRDFSNCVLYLECLL